MGEWVSGWKWVGGWEWVGGVGVGPTHMGVVVELAWDLHTWVWRWGWGWGGGVGVWG